MTTIHVNSALKKFRIDFHKVKFIVDQVCAQLGLSHCTLAINFVGDNRMRTLNKRWRGKDRTTDVLSFSQVSFKTPLRLVKAASNSRVKLPQNYFVGDIVISPQYAAKNARQAKKSLNEEVCLLLVHGILHLGGHDHEEPDDEKRMFKIQDHFMNKLRSTQTNKSRPTAAKPVWNGLVRSC